MKAILGIKKGMTRVYDGDVSVPVTVVDIKDCVVSYKNENAIEISLGKTKGNKALIGKYKELGFVPKYRKVYKNLENVEKVGEKIMPIEESSFVNVLGVSKGKGFAGVVKRYKFAGGPKTHGQSDRTRAPGSIGAGTDPGRVIKGLRMGGRMGQDTVKLKNRKIVKVIEDLLLIKGPLPGSNGDLVIIEKE